MFDTPFDRLVWDVGHQAYPHKVLTGRRERLHTIKQDGGLAPFPSRSESEYDTFGVGHSSTSVSAALGMAVAAARAGENRAVVAIIGDGALTAGMAFEALNHAGSLPANLLVILNDNDMSISENVGALSNYFARALSGRVYAHLREGGKKVLRQMPAVWELARRSEEHLKGMVPVSYTHLDVYKRQNVFGGNRTIRFQLEQPITLRVLHGYERIACGADATIELRRVLNSCKTMRQDFRARLGLRGGARAARARDTHAAGLPSERRRARSSCMPVSGCARAA